MMYQWEHCTTGDDNLLAALHVDTPLPMFDELFCRALHEAVGVASAVVNRYEITVRRAKLIDWQIVKDAVIAAMRAYFGDGESLEEEIRAGS